MLSIRGTRLLNTLPKASSIRLKWVLNRSKKISESVVIEFTAVVLPFSLKKIRPQKSRSSFKPYHTLFLPTSRIRHPVLVTSPACLGSVFPIQRVPGVWIWISLTMIRGTHIPYPESRLYLYRKTADDSLGEILQKEQLHGFRRFVEKCGADF